MIKNKINTLVSLFVVLMYGCVSSVPTSYSPATSTPLLPENILTYQCLEVMLSLPLETRPQGILIIDEQQPYLLSIKTGEKTALNSSKFQFHVSPNGNWFASRYMDDNNKSWLSIETVGGVQQIVPWNDDWFLLGGWVDNEHIWISHYTEPLLTVVNPFSGEEQELKPDFPGLETVAQEGEHYALGASTVIYSSSQNYVVYPRLEEDGYVYIVLWDQQANHVLAKVKDVGKSFSYDPLWSLDETQIYVAVIDKWDSNKPEDSIENFFSLSQDGRVRQLTDFGASFVDTFIGGVSLSPDGRKIAFWLQVRPSPYVEPQLAVLDLETKQVTSYCIPGSYRSSFTIPAWSLDGRYLAVQSQYEPNAGRIILVDTNEGWAAQIAEITQGWPAGWLADH